MKPLSCFQKKFKMKKVFALHLSDLIMVESLKIIPLKSFVMKMTSPRTPQQNGVVERKNKSLQEMARTMLLDSRVRYTGRDPRVGLFNPQSASLNPPI